MRKRDTLNLGSGATRLEEQIGRGQYQQGYADGIRDLAERLNLEAIWADVSDGYGRQKWTHAITTIEIDRIAKEMTEGKP